ncbi:MAG TPA: hypothetical protein VFZ27_08725 [Terriglobia bacterium]|nr:hypothetical protein [Terriglobia bacterium]
MALEERCVFKGVVAGLVGGLIGTIVMNEFQGLWNKVAQNLQNGQGRQPQQSQQESESPTMKAAAKIAKLGGRELTYEERKKLGPVVHYSFGTLQGAVYGGTSELAGTRGGFIPGMIFGAALFAAADELAVPQLGLTGKPSEMPASSHLYGLASHLVYGLSAEIARRGLRAAL